MCFIMLGECNIVNEGLKVKLYPDKVMVDKFNQSLMLDLSGIIY